MTVVNSKIWLDRVIWRALLAIVVVALVILPALSVSGSFPNLLVSLPLIQYLLFPLVIALFWFAPIRVPRVIPFFAGLAGLVCAITLFFSPTSGAGSVIVSQLVGDELGNDSLALRDQIRRAARFFHLDLNSSKIYKEIATSGAAIRALDNREAGTALLWGTATRINLSIKGTPLSSISAFDRSGNSATGRSNSGNAGVLLTRSKFSGLSLVTAVSGVGVAYHPLNDAIFFLTHYAAGAIAARSDSGSVEMNNDAELSLKVAGLTGGPQWRSFSHLAAPLWELGNRYLGEALSEDLERGYVRCALSVYGKGLSYLRPGDNFELQAAILNNSAIAYSLLYLNSLEKRDLVQAKKLLKRAEISCREWRESFNRNPDPQIKDRFVAVCRKGIEVNSALVANELEVLKSSPIVSREGRTFNASLGRN